MQSFLGKIVLLAGIVLGVISPVLAMYLVWTPVGSNELAGFQQRYCFPSAILALALFIPTANLASGEYQLDLSRAVRLVCTWIVIAFVTLIGIRYIVGLHMVLAARFY